MKTVSLLQSEYRWKSVYYREQIHTNEFRLEFLPKFIDLLIQDGHRVALMDQHQRPFLGQIYTEMEQSFDDDFRALEIAEVDGIELKIDYRKYLHTSIEKGELYLFKFSRDLQSEMEDLSPQLVTDRMQTELYHLIQFEKHLNKNLDPDFFIFVADGSFSFETINFSVISEEVWYICDVPTELINSRTLLPQLGLMVDFNFKLIGIEPDIDWKLIINSPAEVEDEEWFWEEIKRQMREHHEDLQPGKPIPLDTFNDIIHNWEFMGFFALSDYLIDDQQLVDKSENLEWHNQANQDDLYIRNRIDCFVKRFVGKLTHI